MKPEALSLKECAQLLSVHPETIRREVRRGRLTAFLVGDTYRVLRSELVAYAKRQTQTRDLRESKASPPSTT